MKKRRTEVSPHVEAEIVGEIERWLDRFATVMTSNGGRQVMCNEFLRQLQATDAATLPTDFIIAAAEAGNEAADWALRIYIANLVNHGREASRQLDAYNVKSLLRPPVRYPRNTTSTIDSWTRDIAIGVAIDVAADRWRLAKTRKPSTLEPSAACFVSLALRRQGIKLTERRVNEIYWARKTLAERIAASLFLSTF